VSRGRPVHDARGTGDDCGAAALFAGAAGERVDPLRPGGAAGGGCVLELSVGRRESAGADEREASTPARRTGTSIPPGSTAGGWD
jgi:hypothetical protein